MEQLHLTMSKEQKAQLQKEAKEKGLTLAAYVRLVLLERNK